MVKIRLNACCFCISLRRGCIGIAFFDVIVNLLIILLGPQELISQPERAVCICHCIGCVMLLLGALISTVLLVFYLITSFVNTAILIICFIIQTVSNLTLRPYVLIFVVVLTAINVYFYIIAYSYYQQVNTPFEEDDEA
ncbi:uncharacterized protein LOC133842178 isoform X2 [Drosophila sulfurigaster albostrigata]|uniref:uncharacterized protein LOC133842178 isoform X2 n=1 Tax=Drosophila sulfurigaster albostrigata TaxID=89887 RepID=UPI002D21C310|nr:uncharacterized protein LOC133842178 isoform X2 [Drosophila sulfurigaster albostrigata]